MITLLTKEAVRGTRDKVLRCLVPSYPLLSQHLPNKCTPSSGAYSGYSWYHLQPNVWSFRGKMEHFFEKLLKLEEGTSEDYILYSARRRCDVVIVKALPKRIKSIRTLHSLEPLHKTEVSSGALTSEKKRATAIMDITFLRCLFSLGSDCEAIDLSKAALPEDDVRVRVGNYNLLYDKVDKEWSLWMRS
jgi:hypothetical protein